MDFDSGNITINGYDLKTQSNEIRKLIGVVFQDSLLDKLLTVRENLIIRAGFYSKSKSEISNMVNNVIKIIELSDFIDRPYGKLSGGQKRRADIAVALLHKPKILFLDEPTTGLDPQTRLAVWEIIKKLQTESGMTIFLTTHYMEEAADSNFVIVIDNGLIAAKGTPHELKSQYSKDSLKLYASSPEFAQKIQDIIGKTGIKYSINDLVIEIKLKNTFESIDIIETCRDYISSFQVLQGSMDDAFIGITGKEIR